MKHVSLLPLSKQFLQKGLFDWGYISWQVIFIVCISQSFLMIAFYTMHECMFLVCLKACLLLYSSFQKITSKGILKPPLGATFDITGKFTPKNSIFPWPVFEFFSHSRIWQCVNQNSYDDKPPVLINDSKTYFINYPGIFLLNIKSQRKFSLTRWTECIQYCFWWRKIWE